VFKEHLSEIIERVDGARMAALIGLDGLPLCVVHGAQENEASVLMAVEFAALMTRAQAVARGASMGSIEELSVEAEALHTVLRPVGSDYFLAVGLNPGGNLGLARYMLSAKAPEIARAMR
jgi:predicted regulator of Ras-like GTPase activity (Roadblock/LC7/MglB family)